MPDRSIVMTALARQHRAQFRATMAAVAQQENKLNQWLESNQGNPVVSSYYVHVQDIQKMLRDQQVSGDVPLSDVLVDLKALNKALCKHDAADLFDRAQHHLAYSSPTAMAIGGSLVAIGLGAVMMSAAIICMPLALVGTYLMVGGLLAVTWGSERVVTNQSSAFFNTAHAINPALEQNINVPRHVLTEAPLPWWGR